MEIKSRHRLLILSLVILVRSCSGIIWASAGPLLPLIMQAYGINRGTAGWFASSGPLAISIVSVPIAIYMARFSLKKTFAIGALLQAGGILAPFCTAYVPLLLTRVCYAIGTSITVTVAIAITAEWFTARELPLINGITISFVNLGNAFAFLATVPIAIVLSWNAPITIYGAIALTCAIAWIIFGKDRRRVRKIIEVDPIPVSDKNAGLSIRQVLTQRSTILLAFAIMGAWCLGNAMSSWLPGYYHEAFKMPLEKASSIITIVTVTGFLACIIGGILPLRLGSRKPFLIIPGVFMGLSALISILFNNPAVIYSGLVLFGIFSNLQTPTLYTIPMELPNLSARKGVIVLSVMVCAGNIGNFIGPLIVGYLADITGSYLPGFIICAIISLSLLLAGLLLPETGVSIRKSIDQKV